MGARHAYVGRGLVYCQDLKESARPLITHSRIKCALCGETVQSAVNPVSRHLKRYAKKAVRYAAGRAGRFLSSYSKKNPNIVDVIQHGDRVTIVDRFGQERTGSAVMRSGDGLGWVLNMGGAHGTPGLAYDNNITKVKKGRNTRSGGLRSRLFGNPPANNGPVKIYGQTSKIFMRKTEGPYKGQRFVHDFKPGVQQTGFPRGTIVRTPNGKLFKMTTRSVVLSGKKDLWRNFPA